MGLARSIKRRARAAAPSVVFLGLVAYFAWNATRGELGLRAYAMRETDLATADQDAWQHKVAALEPAHLDSDALDERARQMLNLSEPGDIVVPFKN
jgi:cell division protein FtsB